MRLARNVRSGLWDFQPDPEDVGVAQRWCALHANPLLRDARTACVGS